MYNFAVVGDAFSSHGFAALGAKIKEAHSPSETLKALEELVKEYKLIFVTDELFNSIETEAIKLMREFQVSIVNYPTWQTKHKESRLIREMAVKALGADVLAKKEKM